MRKISLLAGATLLLAGPAVAADLAKPVYKAPAFVPAFTWTGCYAGASVGGAWAHQSAGTTTVGNPNALLTGGEFPVLTPFGQADTAGDLSQGSSVIGGPYVGCNYQWATGVVFGAELDFNWTSLSGSFDAPNIIPGFGQVPGGVSMTSDTRWTASLRARLGYAVMPNVLLYGTGGVARTTTDYTGVDTFNTGGSVSTAFSSMNTGWVAGGGVEWAPWSNNWIVRLEYLHYGFGGASATVGGLNAAFPSKPGVPFSTTFNFGNLTLDTVRAGISYKF